MSVEHKVWVQLPQVTLGIGARLDNGADCKSVGESLSRFDSYPIHLEHVPDRIMGWYA